ncbi:peptidase M16 [Sporosarcina sp. NCCP-2716]|nr:peptidase M16 [Sporosarcina sp. NCCP-2716]
MTLHLIENKNVKTVTVECKLQTLLDRKTITERTLLPGILRAGCSEYPTAKEMQEHLDDLYGASLVIYPSTAGNSHVLTVQLEFANERFIGGEDDLAENVYRFLNEILYHPRTEGDGFDPRVVEQEKEKLKKALESAKDDRAAYADERLLDEMAPDERYSVHPNGYLEDLAAITPNSLLAAYRELLATARFDLFVAGDLDFKRNRRIITETVTDGPRSAEQLETGLALPAQAAKPSDVKTFTETEQIQQAKLHIGYRTGRTFRDTDFEALMVGSVLLGGHPGSLLFSTIREEHSLAYYVGADLDMYSDKLFVYCGIAPNDYEAARKLIAEQIAILKDGSFSDENLEDSKTMLVGSYQTSLDSVAGMVATEYQKVLTGSSKSPVDMAETFKTITREDVVRAVRDLDLDTVFLLTSEEAGR